METGFAIAISVLFILVVVLFVEVAILRKELFNLAENCERRDNDAYERQKARIDELRNRLDKEIEDLRNRQRDDVVIEPRIVDCVYVHPPTPIKDVVIQLVDCLGLELTGYDPQPAEESRQESRVQIVKKPTKKGEK